MIDEQNMSILTRSLVIFVIVGVCVCEYDKYEGPMKCSCNENTNESTDLLSQTVSKIQCCHGRAECKRKNEISYNVSPSNHLVCFSDTSCVHNKYKLDSGCYRNTSECFLDKLSVYNVSNIFKHWSIYKCIEVYPSNHSICLLSACKSFAAVERTCTCDQFSCTCYTFSEALKNQPNISTFAVFLSFAETSVTIKPSRFSFKTILIILFSVIGLIAAVFVLLKCILFVRTIHTSTQNASCVINRFPNISCRNPRQTKENNGYAQSSSQEPNLPTYKEAIQNEKIFVIEPPPVYSDTMSQ